MKPPLVGSVVVAAALLAGGILPARGVPDSGWTVTELAKSTISKPIAVEASGPTGVVMHHVVWQPGGINGWHTHPGPVFVQVKLGTFTLYTSGDGHCTRTDYPAGQGFLEHPGAVHVGRNESPEPFEVYVTWVGLPAGAPLFKAEPNPTGAGCPTLNPATERISRTELVQATTTEPVTIRQDGPSGIVMQQIQAAPGSGSGWRRQVGAAVFAVRSGAVVVTRVDHAGVATRTYRAGDAFVVAAGEVYRPCNEASEPAELYVTFLGLRRGQRDSTQMSVPVTASPRLTTTRIPGSPPAPVSGAARLAGRARSRSAQLPPGHRHHSESPVASRLAALTSPGTQPTRALEYLRDRCPGPRNLVGRLGRGLDPNAPAVDPWGRS